MTTVIVTHEDNEVDEFAFDASDRIISIGRRSTNDVCIPNLSVSGMHARITIDGDSASIEDNNSTNGTYVNGRLISRQLLNEHDEIVIGKTRVVVQLNNVDHASDVAPAHAAEAQPALNHASDDYHASDDHASDDYDNDYEDADDSFVGETTYAADDHALEHEHEAPENKAAGYIAPDYDDQDDDQPMSLSDKAKLALGRSDAPTSAANTAASAGVAAVAASSATAAASRAFADSDVAVAEAPPVFASESHAAVQHASDVAAEPHPLDGLDEPLGEQSAHTIANDASIAEAEAAPMVKTAGAVIEIQNGAKSGQVLPIDKPVTTLGRPGIQIAAIMRKPDGYFLMHIESDDSVDMPTLNRDTIGDDPVQLHSGDRLNVAGIDVEFMLS